MTLDVTQSQANTLVVSLTTTGGFPALGRTFADVVCVFRKEGDVVFTTKSLTSLNFIEIGNGVYTVSFTAGELDTLGPFVYLLSGTGLNQFVDSVNVVVLAPAIVPVCIVTGHITDLSGSPVAGVAVSAKIVGLPTILDVGAVSVGFLDKMVSALTDGNGQFFITLPRLITVQVFIPQINYTRILSIPDVASADLFDIP